MDPNRSDAMDRTPALPPMTRYVCLSLPKTGTTTFHQAMQLLGYNSLHDAHRSRQLIHYTEYGELPAWYHDTQALSDGHLFRCAERLYQLDPEARFIFWRRDCEARITSDLIHVLHSRIVAKAGLQHHNTQLLRQEHQFADRVYDRLAGRPRVHEIQLADGWPALCNITGDPIPDQPFPRANTATQHLREILDALT